MYPITNIIQNPLLKEIHQKQREELINHFPVLKFYQHNSYLSLYKYISVSPYYFYSEIIQKLFFNWLEDRDKSDRDKLQNFLAQFDAELNRSYINLLEINKFKWHDNITAADDYDLLIFIDKEIHPSYLRLTEGVFKPICRMLAIFLRLDRGKGIDDLNDLYSIVQEIENSPYKTICNSYIHIIRNGIAHGGITYLQKEIRYNDKKGREESFSDKEIIDAFDNLLDTCNALLLSLSLFLVINQLNGYNLLQEVLIEELRAETRTPWWEIVGCVRSGFENLNHLLIYAKANSYDFSKVQMSTFQSGILAERYAPGYDRYFFSLHSYKSLPGWITFNGKQLKQLREKNAVYLEEYNNIIINDLFYIPKIRLPRIFFKLNNYYLSFKLHWPLVVEKIKQQYYRPNIIVREARIHRNSWGCVLNGCAILKMTSRDICQDVLRNTAKRIIQKTLSEARRKKSFFSLLYWLPLGYARVSVFSNNYRIRRLANHELCEDLICTIQVKRIKRIKCTDLYQSTVEKYQKYHIAWNKSWLEKTLQVNS